jgi:signal transduction histidine kinase
MADPAGPRQTPPASSYADVLAGVVRALARGGADAPSEAVRAVAKALDGSTVVLRAADESRAVLATSGDSSGRYRLDLPLRSGESLVGNLTVHSARPLPAHAQRLLPAVGDALALALHLAEATGALEQSLLDAEADRAELAHDLHEGIAQTVVAARHAVSVHAEASTVSAVLARAGREGRRMVGLLRPRAVDGDLGRALHALASDLTSTGTPVVIDCVAVPLLPSALATLAYRVVTASVREEIGSIRVQVRLIRAETLLVTVTGMVDAMDAGVAARWRRRVQAAGGVLEVTVDSVRVELPVPADESAIGATVATLGARR